jgi:hypothetical protein
MPTEVSFRSGAVSRSAARLLTASLLFSAVAFGQPGQNAAEKSSGASKNDKIAHAIVMAERKNSASLHFVEQLAQAGAVQAIPMLEEKFAGMQGSPNKSPSWDAVDKAHLASALVWLGDKKEIYWDYLVKQATLAVENDAPNPTIFDSRGKAEMSPEFIAWVKAHNLGHPGVWDQYGYALAGPVLWLGATGDPRAVPVLRRGLLSPNYMVEYASAQGLAHL